ncbi:MAG TPA: GC-type dockerin domain-anchored protein, partial [Rugosimonospora sp.]|nr:GC-type dockerin domain-anchored protein [Rugosimonospora sp.]
SITIPGVLIPGDPPACVADYNNSGAANLQDIFDFLSGWFAGDAHADINGVGGLTIQDIFDFLAAWFTGCP